MKPFECTVRIDLPIDKVIALWSDTDNLKFWQDGFVGVEQLKGQEGELGAQKNMTYKVMGGRKEITLLETVLVSDLPREFKGSYVGESMTNTMISSFATDGRFTTWTSRVHYTEMKGFMVKLMTRLMPGMFKKQVQKWMDQFKVFAEAEMAIVEQPLDTEAAL